jgi:hypothetical protein
MHAPEVGTDCIDGLADPPRIEALLSRDGPLDVLAVGLILPLATASGCGGEGAGAFSSLEGA